MFDRDGCFDCTRKHLGKAQIKMGKAQILLVEADLGYPKHAYFAEINMEEAEECVWSAHDLYFEALAQISEAEDEILEKSKELAEKIREERLKLQDDFSHQIQFNTLIREVTLIAQKIDRK